MPESWQDMYKLKITYDGDQHTTALKEPHHNTVAVDCPFTGKGAEFSPASLLGISLASCMLLSMGAVAQRDELELKGTVVDIDLTGLDSRFPHVDSISLRFRIPHNLPTADRRKLELAASHCPIMASIDVGTTVSTHYEYGVTRAA